MGWIALLIGTAALVSAALPNPGLFVAIGLAILAGAAGWNGYRRREDGWERRLAGAAGLTLATIALLFCGIRYTLTLMAISELERFLT